MRLPFDDLQAAIVDRLSGNLTDENSQIVQVLDDVPRGTPYPYVELGEYDAEFDYSKTTTITEATCVFDVFSSYAGTKEVNSIMRQMTEAFFQPFPIGNNFELLSEGFVEDAQVVKGETADQEILRIGTLEYRWRVADQLD